MVLAELSSKLKDSLSHLTKSVVVDEQALEDVLKGNHSSNHSRLTIVAFLTLLSIGYLLLLLEIGNALVAADVNWKLVMQLKQVRRFPISIIISFI